MNTNFIFFTGKGGVGKTSLSCATAIQEADSGKKVLLVSTDPASNLQDVLESPIGETISAVRGVKGLFAVNIDPELSAAEYRKRATEPLKGLLPDAEIARMQEELSGACTVEIAAFDEFSRFISGESEGERYDVIIFDTAPTGHTLRLLELPAAWASFSEENPDGASCLGPSSALKSSQARYHTVVDRLRDADLTTFYLVARADGASLKEASRTSDELKALGLAHQKLLLNGVFKALDRKDPFALQMEQMAAEQLENIPANLRSLDRQTYPLLPYNVMGVKKLRSLLSPGLQQELIQSRLQSTARVERDMEGLNDLVDRLSAGTDHGLIMTMGKGGVGKTLTASAIALLLAKKGLPVHLTTTDPAGNVQDFVQQVDNLPENLTIDRIDPKEETKRYIQTVITQKSKTLDAEGIKLMEEDLKSPCTEEVAVFHAFSKAISEAKRKFVVIDTAPTGHTLLLLDTAGSYHREIMRNTTLDKVKIRTPFMALQDHDLSKVLIVSLPETTPMREAATLQDDLQRAGITPYAWIINQSLSMREEISDPLLQQRAAAEEDVIKNIEQKLALRTYGIPYLAEKQLLPALLASYDRNPTPAS